MSQGFCLDWSTISFDAKQKAGWCCQECGKPGYRPGDLIRNRAYLLDCHHINRDRSCNSLDNLRVLCKSCHIRSHSKKEFSLEQSVKVEQLSLLGEFL